MQEQVAVMKQLNSFLERRGLRANFLAQQVGIKTVNNITNNSRPIEVQIGDTIIHGADQSTVDKHIKVTRDMVNQIGRLIGIGR